LGFSLPLVSPASAQDAGKLPLVGELLINTAALQSASFAR
jgi:hypothetical protein